MGEISYTGATSGKRCRLIEVLQKRFPTAEKRAINAMAEEIKERTSGCSKITSIIKLKELFPNEPNIVLAVIAEAILEEAGASKLYTKGNEVVPKYSTLDERYEEMPGNPSSVGHWTGEPGEATFVSTDERVADTLKEIGVSGIEYKNGMPDFSQFVIEEFKIDKMTEDRPKNFAQANKKLAEKLTKETGEKWTAKRVSDWIKENNYTWHELNDCETIQLVPSEINHPIFQHLGGCGEYKIMLKNGGK
ncbi:HNH endonuclease [Pseudobacteroides cellulosolvens]|uniref:Uncharacterized protein n=1 Tax=Pseudobacteroides cellulosolvens ATCC 35603 = DSM 2933 TaxID=398512 RepID=A0A0L6JKS8_9FIRM|nr:HNH endonuclease [Pseudobacteroides cellulosolvens]KNY26365.1 hypothetical protein Bccel_1627 [Pseudobacteroides cellulosolvens ATCC 35603 = DSM 2933]